jgi:excisionase family DNA binding protein
MTFDEAPQQLDIDLNKFYRTGQVADLLKVSKDTVVRMARDGRLPFNRTLGSANRPGIRRFQGRDVLAVWLEMNQYM